MRVAVIYIGTSKYRKFFDGYYEGITKNFLRSAEKTFFIFTDDPTDTIFDKPNVVKTHIDHEKWPFITLHRFKYMRLVKDRLREYDYVFFVDADLWCVSEVTEPDLLVGKPLVGVQHPGFIGAIGSFETDTRSHANIFDGYYNVTKYRQGCLWGGKSENVVEMVCELDRWVDEDKAQGIVAAWHDESHMNKYFLINNDSVHTLHPGFAQPQSGYDHVRSAYPTKFVHLHKEMSEFPRFEGIR